MNRLIERTVRRGRARARFARIGIGAAAAMASPYTLAGQSITSSLTALTSTPLGALLPAAPPMPTSRDNLAVIGLRAVYGTRDLGNTSNRLTTYGLAADVLFQGRTMLSALFGYQRTGDDVCELESCPSRRLMGAVRFSGNLVTTRPFLPVPFFTANNATGSAGFEIGAGFGSRAFGDRSHWATDVSIPLSLSVGQRFRVVPFAVPTLAFVWGTTPRKWSRDAMVVASGGLGIQEIGQLIGIPGVDVTFSVQRAFMPHGTALGVTLGWVHVP